MEHLTVRVNAVYAWEFFSVDLCKKVRSTRYCQQYLNSVDWHRHYRDVKLSVAEQNLKNSTSSS